MSSLPLLPQGRAAPAATSPSPAAPSHRLALWELEGSLQCSIIGTCLSDQDLLAAMRKNRLQIEQTAQSYDIHGYCVRATHRDCPLARTLNKLLDRRFAGAVRLMTRATTPQEMQSLWERLREDGQVAAGYWAIMSHAGVPAALRTRAFGEVHMLSHLHGHGATQLASRLTAAEQRCADLEARLKRSQLAKSAALAERDAARAAAVRASDPCIALAAQVEPPAQDRAIRRLQARLAKCERALTVARARARGAEDEARRLTAAADGRRRCSPERVRPAEPAAVSATPVQTGARVLYIGGRTAIVPHLRSAAEARLTAFLHHDGGIEDSLHRIEEMIAGCDAVVCPVDCISHGACRMAKAICQRLKRRFLPIPTASRSGFERALDQLATEPRLRHGEAVSQ